MTQHIVQYKVKPDQVTVNEQGIRAIFDELERVRPAGLRYDVFKLSDGETFIHIVAHEGEQGRGHLAQLHAFKAFHKSLRERCEEAPVRTELSTVGSFRC